MNNIINYYYGINLLDVYELNGYYYFNYHDRNYFLVPYERNYYDLKDIVNLVRDLKNRNILTNEIITNKFNSYITLINKKYYCLIKENTKDSNITMNDILYIQNNTYNINAGKSLYRNEIVKMWENKIDYYEEKMNEIKNRFKLVDKSIDYYIGLAENAVVYLINNNVKVSNMVVSHRRIKVEKGSFDFYNPINYIIDNRTRDFAEYVKDMFFNNNLSFDLFVNYLEYMNFTREEYILLISRLLFPTYYFDLLDRIINEEEKDIILEGIINKTDDYIVFLRNTMNYILINKRMNIPYISWIIKK